MATDKKTDEVEKTRFAVYDNTLLRYLDGVFDTKAEAETAKKNGPEGHDLEVREV